MSQLKDYKDLEEVFFIIDLFASEYGWTIEEVQRLTIPEISGLIYAMAKRKLGKDAEEKLLPAKPASPEDEMKKLVALATKLKASPKQLNDLKSGKQIKL